MPDLPTPAQESAAMSRLSVSTQIEKLIAINAGNRFIWLVFVLCGLLLLQLSLLQRNTLRFDTMDLIAILLAVLEAGAVLSLLLLLGGTPNTRRTWQSRFSDVPFNYIANAIAAMLLSVVATLVLLIPLMIAHQYPDLAAEGVRVPLTIFQRTSVMLGLVLITGNLVCILRFYLRLSWPLAAMFGLVAHLLAGYLITLGSLRFESMRRLNDVFYYNQLWHYFDWIPNLQRPQVFHNMQQPHTVLYLLAAALLWIVTFLLWAPRASWEASRSEPKAK